MFKEPHPSKKLPHMPIDPATTDRRAEYHDSTYIRDYKGSFSYIFCCEIPVHVRAEAGETNKAEHTLSNASAWLFKKKKITSHLQRQH